MHPVNGIPAGLPANVLKFNGIKLKSQAPQLTRAYHKLNKCVYIPDAQSIIFSGGFYNDNRII